MMTVEDERSDDPYDNSDDVEDDNRDQATRRSEDRTARSEGESLGLEHVLAYYYSYGDNETAGFEEEKVEIGGDHQGTTEATTGAEEESAANNRDNQDGTVAMTGAEEESAANDRDNQDSADTTAGSQKESAANNGKNKDTAVADAVTGSDEESAAKDGKNKGGADVMRGSKEKSAKGIDFASLTDAEISSLNDKDYGRYRDWQKKEEENEKKVQAISSGLMKQAVADRADREKRAESQLKALQDMRDKNSQNIQERVRFPERHQSPQVGRPPEPLTHLEVPDHSESPAPANALSNIARAKDACALLKTCSEGKALKGVCLSTLSEQGEQIYEPTRSLIKVPSAEELTLTSCDTRLHSETNSYAVAAKLSLNISSLLSWGLSSVTSTMSAFSRWATSTTASQATGTASTGSAGGALGIGAEGKYSASHRLNCVRRFAINLPQKHDLRLSSEAVRALEEIEKARKESVNASGTLFHYEKLDQLGAKVTEFFRTFGSHLPQGPIILGGMHNVVGVAFSGEITVMGKLESSARQAMEKELASSNDRDPSAMLNAAGGLISSVAGIAGGAAAAQAAGSIVSAASAALPKESNADGDKDTEQNASESQGGGSIHVGGVVSKASTHIKGGTHFANISSWKAALEYKDEDLAVVDQGEYLIPVHELVMQDMGLNVDVEDRKALVDCLRSRYFCCICSYCHRACFPARQQAHERECKKIRANSLYREYVQDKLKDGYELGQQGPDLDETLGYYLVETVKCDFCEQHMPAVDYIEHKKLCIQRVNFLAGSNVPTPQVGIEPNQVRLENGDFKHIYLYFPHPITDEQRVMFRDGWNWTVATRDLVFQPSEEVRWVYRVTDKVIRAINQILNCESDHGLSLLSNVANHVYSFKKDADFKEACENVRATLKLFVDEAPTVIGKLLELAWLRQEFGDGHLDPKSAKLILRLLRNEPQWNDGINSQELEQMTNVMLAKETTTEIRTEICQDLIRNLVHGEASTENRKAVVDSGIVEHILRAMEGESLASESLQEQACASGIAEHILGAMECESLASEKLLEQACAVIGNLAVDSCGRDYVVEHGGFERIIAAAQLRPTKKVLEQARWALCNVVKSSKCVESLECDQACVVVAILMPTDDVDMVAIRNVGGIPVLVSMITAFLQSQRVQEEACAAIRNLADGNVDNCVAVREAGGIPAVVRAMTAHPQAERVQEQACGFLRNMGNGNADNCVAVREAGGIPAIVRAMSAHPQAEGVQEGACIALRNLALDDDNCVAVREAGGIPAVVRAMAVHLHVDRVQEQACRALLNLTSHNSDNRVAVREAGGIPAIVRSMNAYPKAQEVQVQACWALRNLAIDDDNEVVVREAEGISAVVRAMSAHPKSEEVQEQACGALCSVAWNEENKAAIAEAGGIPAIIRAMTAHSQAEEVQWRACYALRNLAINADNKVAVREAGGIPAIVGAMSAHPQAVKVQWRACAALRSLACNSDNKAAIAEAGGIPFVIGAMAAHPQAEELLVQACVTLYFLAGNEDNNAAIRKAGGVDQLKMAKKNNAGSAKVQEEADDALRELEG